MSAAEVMVAAAEIYCGAGLVFSIGFAARGVSRLDPAAEGAGIAFRLLLIPGATALWPLLAVRWAKSARKEAKEA